MIKNISIKYTGRDDLIAVKGEVAAYPPDHVLVQVFSGVLDQSVVKGLLTGIQELFPGVSVVGTSSAGEIMDTESLENTVLVNFSLFECTSVRSILITQNDNLTQAGWDIGKALRQDDVKAVIVLGCGLKDRKTINGEPLLRAIHAELGDALIAGGQAGDNGQGNTTFVFTEKGITEHGVAAASLAGKHLVANSTYNLSWVPIGKKLTITEASGPHVYRIDDKTPYDIYVHYLGQEVADNLPLSAADFPLIINRDGIDLAIHATGINDDGSFMYVHDLFPGEQLRFGFCHAGLLALAAQVTHYTIRGFNPQIVFIYSCVARKWILGADIAVDLSPFADLAPSAGFFCYGEYYHHKVHGRLDKPYLFGQTMTVLSLSEGVNDNAMDGVEDGYSLKIEESKQFKTMRVLHQLVDVSTREIENMNVELARLVSKDALTNLANRRLFDEKLEGEFKRHGRSHTPLSLLMIDIDHFKKFNDTYGHVAGDNCLRAVSQVLGRNMRRPSDIVARYGGEEFACILPITDHGGALTLAETIRHGVEILGIPHAVSDVSRYVTLSIGVLTVEDIRGATSEKLLEACDALLYGAKEQGRNRVVGKALSSLS